MCHEFTQEDCRLMILKKFLIFSDTIPKEWKVNLSLSFLVDKTGFRPFYELSVEFWKLMPLIKESSYLEKKFWSPFSLKNGYFILKGCSLIKIFDPIQCVALKFLFFLGLRTPWHKIVNPLFLIGWYHLWMVLSYTKICPWWAGDVMTWNFWAE